MVGKQLPRIVANSLVDSLTAILSERVAAPVVKTSSTGWSKTEGESAELNMARLMGQNDFIPVKIFFFRRKAIDLRRQFDQHRFTVVRWASSNRRHGRCPPPRGTRCISLPLNALA